MMKRKWLALFFSLFLLVSLRAQGENDVRYAVDFDYLAQLAPNACAWLYQEESGISVPVVWTDNPTFYLRRGYNGLYSQSGGIYLLSDSAPDMGAQVITLRGANCMDYSLFGSLSEYREPEYYAAHPSFRLITPEGDYQLDVFAGLRTRHKDHETWVVNPGDDLLGEKLPALLEQSFLTPAPAALPEEGDSWVVLTTEASDNSGNRYVVYARRRPLPESDAPAAYLNEMDMDSRETQNGYATAEGVGTWMIYGQNDPSWRRLIFEVPHSSRNRPFGDGGCGPTSIAMALANLVPMEELPKIREYASDPLGYVFCTCCIGRSQCNVGHVPYQLQTPEDYLRYFPLAVADFAMGNNTLGVQGRRDSFGTNMSYLEAICSLYGVSVTRADGLEDAAAFLREDNTIAITCASGSYNPFTRTSHFLVLARATDEHFYVLDPLRRESYEELDHYGVLEKLAPGLVRVKLEDARVCHFSPIYLLKYETAQ